LGVVIAGAHFVLHGSTALSLSLSGAARRLFQITVAILVPFSLSVLLIPDTEMIARAPLWHLLSDVWILVPLAIIAFISWIFGAELDAEHPFRGFIAAAGVLFILCYFGYHGMSTSASPDGELIEMYLDPQKAQQAKQDVVYFWQFLIYVVTTYMALLARRYQQRLDQQRTAITIAALRAGERTLHLK
jgi:hypothetical protein